MPGLIEYQGTSTEIVNWGDQEHDKHLLAFIIQLFNNIVLIARLGSIKDIKWWLHSVDWKGWEGKQSWLISR